MELEKNKANAVAVMETIARSGTVDCTAFTGDATWWTPVTGALPIGIHAERFGKLSAGRFAGPGRFAIDGVMGEGDTVVIEARGFQPLKDGRSYDNTYIWVVRFRDGRICSVRAYFDTALAQRTMQATEK